jgi:hypothetical protein
MGRAWVLSLKMWIKAKGGELGETYAAVGGGSKKGQSLR